MDRKMFLAILKRQNISVDTDAVAEELTTADQPCTAVAVKRRLQKIKEKMKADAGYVSQLQMPFFY